jgi:hypothetical protein
MRQLFGKKDTGENYTDQHSLLRHRQNDLAHFGEADVRYKICTRNLGEPEWKTTSADTFTVHNCTSFVTPRIQGEFQKQRACMDRILVATLHEMFNSVQVRSDRRYQPYRNIEQVPRLVNPAYTSSLLLPLFFLLPLRFLPPLLLVLFRLYLFPPRTVLLLALPLPNLPNRISRFPLSPRLIH